MCQFLWKLFWKIKIFKTFTNRISFDLRGQGKYLQLEKTSRIEIEMPIQKRLVMDLLKGMAKRTPLVLIGLSAARVIESTIGPELESLTPKTPLDPTANGSKFNASTYNSYSLFLFTFQTSNCPVRKGQWQQYLLSFWHSSLFSAHLDTLVCCICYKPIVIVDIILINTSSLIKAITLFCIPQCEF